MKRKMAKSFCIFCSIVRKESTASLVYENDQVLAFMDIRPVSKGHTLVIPKEHYENIFDISESLLTSVQIATKKLAHAIRAATNADGISIVQQNGRAANQEIMHFHVHIIPRFEGQKALQFSGAPEQGRKELDETANRIKKNI